MMQIPRVFLFFGLLLAAATLLSSCATGPTTMAPRAFSTVVIDAGHGGKDSGEHSRSGLVEKELTLDTAQRLRPLLEDAGLHTVMTRTDDTFVELDDRVAIADAHPESILVSIHYNASPSSIPRGAQTFFWQRDSYGLALRVQRHLVQETGLDNRGITRRVLRLTHNPRVPSIRCECGFLTNASDANVVRDPDFRQRVAEGLAAGIIEQEEQGDVDIGSLPPLSVTRTPVYHYHATHSRSSHSHATHTKRRHHHQPPSTQN